MSKKSDRETCGCWLCESSDVTGEWNDPCIGCAHPVYKKTFKDMTSALICPGYRQIKTKREG